MGHPGEIQENQKRDDDASSNPWNDAFKPEIGGQARSEEAHSLKGSEVHLGDISRPTIGSQPESKQIRNSLGIPSSGMQFDSLACSLGLDQINSQFITSSEHPAVEFPHPGNDATGGKSQGDNA